MIIHARAHNSRVRRIKLVSLLFHPAQPTSSSLHNQRFFFLFCFVFKPVSYLSSGDFNACDTYAYILKTGNRLWHAIHTSLHFTVFPYHSVLSYLIIFTGGVWMHHNLVTWSLNNGNLCCSQYFVITKNCFNEYPWPWAFPTSAAIL